MDGGVAWIDGKTDAWIHRCMIGWMVHGFIDDWMHGWMDGCILRCMIGWMDGAWLWMHDQKHGCPTEVILQA